MGTTASADNSNTGSNEITHAMLVRGRIYVLASSNPHKEFMQDVIVPATPAEIARLKTHAIDLITLEGENETESRPKFVYFTAEQAQQELDRRAEQPAGAIDQVPQARPRPRPRQR